MLSSIRDALFWAPPWLSSVAVLLIAVICALVAHRILFVVFGRAFGDRHPFLRTVVWQTKGPLALALVVFALAAALQSAPFSETVSASFGRLLLIAFIVLTGWIAHVAVETGSSVYLHRFTAETADTLLARKHITQVRILKRALHTLIVVVTLSAVLMTFEPVRQYGVSLFASAGVAGLVVGLAARPLLTNLIAGIQIATTQPIRIDDQVVVENESGRIEEITSTYVVVRLWDLRRLIVPLTLFIEKPFQNWTRELDQPDRRRSCSMSISPRRSTPSAPSSWRSCNRPSCGTGKSPSCRSPTAEESSIELRALASARSAGDAFDLRCDIREQLIAFLQTEHPTALPHARAESLRVDTAETKSAQPDAPPGKREDDERRSRTAAR